MQLIFSIIIEISGYHLKYMYRYSILQVSIMSINIIDCHIAYDRDNEWNYCGMYIFIITWTITKSVKY